MKTSSGNIYQSRNIWLENVSDLQSLLLRNETAGWKRWIIFSIGIVWGRGGQRFRKSETTFSFRFQCFCVFFGNGNWGHPIKPKIFQTVRIFVARANQQKHLYKTEIYNRTQWRSLCAKTNSERVPSTTQISVYGSFQRRRQRATSVSVKNQWGVCVTETMTQKTNRNQSSAAQMAAATNKLGLRFAVLGFLRTQFLGLQFSGVFNLHSCNVLGLESGNWRSDILLGSIVAQTVNMGRCQGLKRSADLIWSSHPLPQGPYNLQDPMPDGSYARWANSTGPMELVTKNGMQAHTTCLI